MGWIISSLCAIVLQVIISVLDWICSIYSTFTLSIGWGTTGANVFDNIFPDAKYFSGLFVLLGIVFILGMLMFKIIYGMIGPSDEIENPITMFTTSVVSMALVFWSYEIFEVVERIFNEVYKLFREVSRAVPTQERYDEDTGFFKQFMGSSNVIGNPGETAEQLAEDLITMDEILLYVILIFMFAALLYQLVSFLGETFLRYVVLGLLFYTCPAAFACCAFKSTRNIFWSWCRMVGAQFLLLMLNLFFMGVFNGALKNLAVSAGADGYLFSSSQDLITTMFCLIGWLVVAQKADSYISSLGLSVAQTGSGLTSALVGGLAMARVATGTVRTAIGAGKGAYNAANKIGEIANRHSGKDAADAYRDQVEKDNHNIASAEQVNGQYTEKGGKAVMGTETQSIYGQKAADAAEAVGITPETADINPEDVDHSQTKTGEHQVSYYDANGNLLGQVAESGKYQTPNGEAMKQVPLKGGGYGDMAVTKNVRDNDVASIQNSLQNDPQYDGMKFSQGDNPNVVYGMNEQTGETKMYAPSYMVEPDASQGAVSYGKTADGVPYTCQDITKTTSAAREESQTATNSAIEQLNSTNSEVTWSRVDQNGDALPSGTFYGYNKDGVPVMQGALDGYADFDRSKGSISAAETDGGIKFSTQSLDNGSGYNQAGFEKTHNPAVASAATFNNMKDVAASPELVRKPNEESNKGYSTPYKSNENIRNATGAWGFARGSAEGTSSTGQRSSGYTPGSTRPTGPMGTSGATGRAHGQASPHTTNGQQSRHQKTYTQETDDRLLSRMRSAIKRKK